MAKIIEAKAVISGEDKLAPMLDMLAKRLDQVNKTAKSAKGVERMAGVIERVRRQMEAIDKYTASGRGFAAARENFNHARIAVEAAARAMREGQGDVRKLEANYRRAQAAVTAASRAFEIQKTAALSAKRGLDELGISGGRIIQEQIRIAAAVDKASAALDRQGKKRGQLRTATGNIAGTLGIVAGPGILHGTKAAVKAGAEIQSKVVDLRKAGIPEGDIQRELTQSAALAATYTNVNRADILERYKELRSVLLHPEEASRLLATTIKANSAVNAIDRSGQSAQGLQFAVKGAEVLGLAQDPKRFEAYLDAFVRAQQVMGKTITPEQMFEFAKYTKASGSSLSDRFKFTTGVSLSQEMGGSTTGVSIDQFVKQITGGFQGNLHSAAKEFVALGLANKDDFETTKTGSIKGMKPGRHVKGYMLAQTDPDRYVSEYLLPALQKAGINDQNAQIAQVRRMFPSTRAADLVAKLITQHQSFENHAALYSKALGLNAFSLSQTDPFVAFNSFSTSLESFAGTLTSPMMENAASVLSSMAGSIGHWSEALSKWQRSNPTTASAVGAGAVAAGAIGGGVLTYNLVSGFLNGFGLKGSAVALDASAVALTRAAVALGGGSVASTAGVSAAGGALARRAAGFAAGVAGGAAAIYFGSTDPAGEGDDAIYRRGPNGKMELTEYGRSLQAGSGINGTTPIQAELRGEAKVTGEAKITIDIPGLGSRVVNVPLNGTLGANGPGSLGVSSPDAAAAPVGSR
jgi:hypothetical protein